MRATSCVHDGPQRGVRAGEYILKELEALVQLHRYRTLRRRYPPQD